MPVQASGGIRSIDDARALLDAGADRVVVGTAAWPDPAAWLGTRRRDSCSRSTSRDGQVRSAGWTGPPGLASPTPSSAADGARVLVTAIDRDGTLAGPDLELVTAAAATGLRVLAAGGVRSPADVEALAATGAEAVVVGRALLGYRAA